MTISYIHDTIRERLEMAQDKNLFSLDANSLVEIDSYLDFVNANNVTLCSFYNKEGGLILTSDRRVPDVLKKQKIYVTKASVQAICPHKLPKVEVTSVEKPSFSSEIKEHYKLFQSMEKIEEAEKEFGQTTVKTVAQSLDQVTEVFTSEAMSKKKYAQAEEIVEETYKLDKTSLSGCLNKLRNVDDYTYNHSFGVYLLFSHALETFKKHMSRPIFFDVFKSINNSVNFNSASLKKYATAALLHDFGKRNIPTNILTKRANLTDREKDIVKYHPRIAVKELHEAGMTDPIFLEIIGNHHREYLTFPQRGQSPLAQICNIVDIYEACRSKRIYKEPHTWTETQQILLSENSLPGIAKWDSFIFVTLLRETFPEVEAERKDYHY